MSDAKPADADSTALVPFEPGVKEDASFVQLAIQAALEQALISPDWVNQLELVIQREAETLADERSQYPAPTEDELKGAQQVTVGYFSFGLEQASRGQVAAAANILSSTPPEDLLRKGEDMFRAFNRRVGEMLLNLKKYGAHLEMSIEVFQYQFGMELFSRSLEEVGRYGHQRHEIERLVSDLWDGQFIVEIGSVLLGRFRRFFARNPGATFNHCLKNLAVNSALGKEDEAELTLTRAEQFRERAVHHLRIKDKVGATMGQWLFDYITSTLHVLIPREWFEQKLWPDLLGSIESHFGGPQPLTGVIETLIVAPSRGKRTEVGISTALGNVGEFTLAEQIMVMPKKRRQAALGVYDGDEITAILEYIAEELKDPDEAGRLLRLQPAAIVGIVLYGYGYDPEDVKAVPSLEMGPSWVRDVVSSFGDGKRAAIKSAIRRRVNMTRDDTT